MSSQGQLELLQVILYQSPNDTSEGMPNLARQTLDILSDGGMTYSTLVDDYASSIHDWFPLLDLSVLRKRIQDPSSTYSQPSHSLLWLAMALVTSQPCGHAQHVRRKRLHAALHCSMSLIQSQNEIQLEFLQAKTLIALYECGQGLIQQAYLTLSSAVAMEALIKGISSEPVDSMHWKVAIMILDR